MNPDLWHLYRQMLRSRLFEQAVARLWDAGAISGEMHTGLGEEGIIAGVMDHVRDGDALALDHRGTSPLILRGVDPVSLLSEFVGHPAGLCKGQGGHMHLFSREHLAASSGIVGASGPAAVGFALAGSMLRPGSVAIAFFGEGAMNEGMLLESLNLAVAWGLPVVFVCKDNGQAIFTDSESQTGGKLVDRARAYGMPASPVDGTDVIAVWKVAAEAVARARAGEGPSFILASCTHLDAHMLGDPALRLVRHPFREGRSRIAALMRALTSRQGAPLRKRFREVVATLRISQAVRQQARNVDPLIKTRATLVRQTETLTELETAVQDEIAGALRQVPTVNGGR